MAEPDDELAKLHAALNHRWLNPWWAKLEILLGLFGMAAGVFGALDLAVTVVQQSAAGPRPAELGLPVGPLVGSAVLFVLGGYLALAGHRSHLYQSNNRLAAYLAERITSRTPGPNP